MVQAMYGAIIGDIVGSLYEHHNFKSKDFGPLFDANSLFTDDTVATIAVADALANAVLDGEFDARTDEQWRVAFTDYLRRYGRRYPNRGWGGHFRLWLREKGYEPYGSAGNGSAMRVSPVAYFARSMEECERLARLSAEVSHNDPDGIAGAQATAGAVYLALHDGTKEEIRAYVDRYYAGEVKAYMQEHGLPAFTLDEIRPGYHFERHAGLCRGTVPFAMQAFYESKDFEDCIRGTVSIGGDTDTLCAISGAVAEAYYGTPLLLLPEAIQRLTPELAEVLDKLEEIDWPQEADEE